MSVTLVDAATAHAALPFPMLVAALRAGFADPAITVPPRPVLQVPAASDAAAGTPPTVSLLMPAWRPGGCYAVKIVNVQPGNAARGLPAVHASVLLHDAATGRPLALIDGDAVTLRRTAAASALAASFLARSDARRLLVCGAGRVASLLPAAHASVRPSIEQVMVWARRPAAAEALAAQLRQQGFAAQAAHDLEAAVRAADVVSCATLAEAPLVRGDWLAPGSHLDLVGSFTPAMREADSAAFAGARWCVDTDEALAKSGDLLAPLADGTIRREDCAGTLAALCRGAAPGRQAAAERTVFKSVGTALEDLVAAELVWAAVAGRSPPA